MGEGRGQRALVEADLRVGQVVVVDQEQVGLLAADELGDLGDRTVDVDGDDVGAVQRTVANGICLLYTSDAADE